MTSVSKKGRERPFVPEIEQHHLRWQLFDEFRKTATYQNAIAGDLRPLWRVAALDAEPDAWNRSFLGLQSMARHRANNGRPALREYVEAVNRFAGNMLHVTRKGQVPTWACSFIHSDVFPASTAHGYGSRDPSDGPPAVGEPFGAVAGELRIFVNPQVARFGQNDDLSTWQTIQASEYMQFDDWDELRREAIKAVKEIVSSMEREFGQKYPQKRRPSTREGQRKQLAAIAHQLLNGGIPVAATQKTLSNLADFLGIDYPRKVNAKKVR